MTKLSDPITVAVDTPYGTITVIFTVLKTISEGNRTYLAYAQDRVAIIQYKANNKWYLIRDMDLAPFITN